MKNSNHLPESEIPYRINKKGILTNFLLFLFCALFSNFVFSQGENPAIKYLNSMNKYLQLPEADAKNNALGQYASALAAYDTSFYTKNQKQLDQNFETGWKGDPIATQAITNASKSLALIYEGNKKPLIKYPHWSKTGIKQPFEMHIPNFLAAQCLGKTLVLSAMNWEAGRNYNAAITTYENCLIFGERMVGDNCALISKLISIAVQSMAVNQIQKFLKRSLLDEKQYYNLILILNKNEENHYPIWKSFAGEADALKWTLVNPEKALQLAIENKEKPEVIEQYKLFIPKKDLLVKQHDEFWNAVINANKQPYPESRKFDVNAEIKKLDKVLQVTVPNYLEAYTRDLVLVAKRRLALINATLRMYKLNNKAFPNDLNALGLKPNLTTDPFVERPFVYRNIGGKITLYSLGPNMTDEGGRTIYDPKKGTVSVGDIVAEF